jgi:hypothetical protein
MSDPRWTDVDVDIDRGILHFDMAIKLFEVGGFEREGIDGYRNSTAFLFAMQAGYTSLENALRRIFDILSEVPPSGENWHRDIIDRAARSISGENARPAIIDHTLRNHLLECMRMRHRARNANYDELDPRKAAPSVEAARVVRSRMADAIADFRAIIDPDVT